MRDGWTGRSEKKKQRGKDEAGRAGEATLMIYRGEGKARIRTQRFPDYLGILLSCLCLCLCLCL